MRAFTQTVSVDVTGRVFERFTLKAALLFVVFVFSTTVFSTTAFGSTNENFVTIDAENLAPEMLESFIPRLDVFPRSVSFYNTDLRGPHPTDYIRVINWGQETVKNVRVHHAGCMIQFDVWDRCFFDLKKGQQCSIDVRFTPTREGYHSCTITILASGGVYETVHVTGRAVDRRRFDRE